MLIDQVKFEQILKDNSLTATKSRKALYQSLAGHNRPISVNSLINSLSDQLDRSTVYRNIETFEKIGVINKVYTGWKYRLELSEKFRPHHHHLTCDNCGKVIPINLGQKMETAILHFGKKNNFKIQNHEIELRGLCSNCY